ncbi:DUF998 domain-containing protein [Actibacterium ureilyticum]|uniref:DUF998 domain-containing protein n=1 Tax=Actibacterium ureilyticum TaxID=1590614 RepID=UPI000BAAE2F6|nr:DUF998 domain-containing protein [Actibacterium ureilyticum]
MDQATKRALGTQEEATNALVLEYYLVRQALGYLGFFLPISLLVYGLLPDRIFQPSISEFYYTHMGDVLVGTLCAIGIFLFSYKGYAKRADEWLSDKWLARIAGLGAIGVALFPVKLEEGQEPRLELLPDINLGLEFHRNWVHGGSAAVFFVCMAIFCIFVFTKGDRKDSGKLVWTGETLIYVSCGVVIIGTIVAMAPYILIESFRAAVTPWKYLYVMESIGVFAFATAWLRKGRGLKLLQAAVDKVAPAAQVDA